jgi:hypothetical protein
MTADTDRPAVSFQRLQRMMAALESDAPLSPELRDEIKLALGFLFITLLIEERHRPGRRRSFQLDHAAYEVHLLVTHFGARVKEATAASLPGGDTRAQSALQRRYQRMKANGEFGQFMGAWNVGRPGERIRLLASRLRSRNK